MAALRGLAIFVSVFASLTGAPLKSAGPDESGRKRGLLHALAFSPDGTMLAAAGESVLVYDVKSGKLVTRWSPPPMTWTIAFLPPARDVVVEAGDGATIRFRKVPAERPFRELNLHTGRVQHVVISPDGKLAVSVGSILVDLRPTRGELRAWKTDSGEIVGSVDIEIGAIFRPVFAPDGKSLLVPQVKRIPGAVGDLAASIELYRIPDWRHLRSIAMPGIVTSAAFYPNGQDLMLAGVADGPKGIRGPGKIWLAHLGNERIEEIVTNRSGVFNHVLYAGPEDRFLFGTSTEIEIGRDRGSVLPQQAKVVMHSDRTGQAIWTSTSEDDRNEVQAIAVSQDGESVAWCTYRTILILDAQRGRLLHGIGVAE